MSDDIAPDGGNDPVSPVNADGSFAENWTEKYGDDSATLLRFKDFDSLVNTHMEQRRKFGKNPDTLVEMPNDESSDKVKAAWSKALGRPETNDLYEYKLSDEHTTKLGPMSETKMTAFREFAHGQNWSQKQFAAALDFYHTSMAGDIDAADISFNEQYAANQATGMAELKAEWLDGTDDRILRANSVMRKYGGEEAVAELCAENNPKMIKFLDNIAGAMGEDTLKGFRGTSELDTKSGIKAKVNENRARMGAIMKENPANYRGDPEFRELDRSNTELYKAMPA